MISIRAQAIKFPQVRFFIAFILLLSILFFGYWYSAIRPYFWIKGAHVECFSTVISSDLAARIVEMGPQEGEFVKKGQLLFAFERDIILAKHSQMNSTLDSLVSEIVQEKGRLGQAMEDYLAFSALGSSASEKVKIQLNVMEEAQEKSQSAQSQIATIKTELGLLDLQLKKMIFNAPFSGVVLKRSKAEGSVVLFGDPIYVLSDPNRIWVNAEIPEEEIRHVLIGTPATFTLAAFPKKEFIGKVTYIGPSAVAEKATIPIKISIENPSIVLKPGLSATVRLKLHL